MEVNVLFIYPIHEQSIYVIKSFICLQMEIIVNLKNAKQNIVVYLDFITFSVHTRNFSEVFAQFFCTQFSPLVLQFDDKWRISLKALHLRNVECVFKLSFLHQ